MEIETFSIIDRDFKGLWIPPHIWMNERLSVTERCLLAEIDRLSVGNNGCFASNNYLARFLNLSPSRVSKIISALEKKTIVKVALVKQGKQITHRNIKVIYEQKKGVNR